MRDEWALEAQAKNILPGILNLLPGIATLVATNVNTTFSEQGAMRRYRSPSASSLRMISSSARRRSPTRQTLASSKLQSGKGIS